MGSLIPSRHSSRLPSASEAWERLGLSERETHRGPSTGLLIAGVVVVGLGVVAWSYLGADLRRYLKIHSM